MKISSNFDSGNIHVIKADHPDQIELAIKNDNLSDFYQWFHFKLHNTDHVKHQLSIINAGQAAYIEGWHDYHTVASYDREHWFRVPTSFDGQTLIIEFTPEFDSVYFAYFTPYSYERHQDLIHHAQLYPTCQLVVLGETCDGRDISVLKLDQTHAQHNILTNKVAKKPVIWLTARQHPGETMAEWFIEGLIERLLDEDDATARYLLAHATFYIIPNMNPDGSVRGHLRTNAVGINLNREWQEPSLAKSPEVFLVREKMLSTGVDMFLDIHGDEAIPYNFLAGCEGCPSFDENQQALAESFKSILLAISPEFQIKEGYPVDEPNKANLSLAATWVGEQFNALSYTIEMPFKDNALLPDPLVGWSSERSKLFGKDVLTAIYHVVDKL